MKINWDNVVGWCMILAVAALAGCVIGWLIVTPVLHWLSPLGG